MKLEEAKAYLDRMEKDRSRNEKYNQRAYRDARELSAWLSLAEHGNHAVSQKARKIIKSI